MVYAISNRMIYRGFHPCLDGEKKIKKPDGKLVKGRWISGGLVTIPMPTKPQAAPQMPVLCLMKQEGPMGSASDRSVCACSVSLFSGTWAQQDWDSLTDAQRLAWVRAGRTSKDWRGLPVFEGDIFHNRLDGRCYVVTFDLLHGFRLLDADTGALELSWQFSALAQKGNLWMPPKNFPQDRLLWFHKARGAETRVEAETFSF